MPKYKKTTTMADGKQKEEFYKEKLELENALKQRNFEIDLFWKRSWFFGALVIVEIAAYYKIKVDNLESFPPVVVAFITCLTILAQCLMNRGSKYWQERWEYMTMNREASLNIELTRLKKFEEFNIKEWLKKQQAIIELLKIEPNYEMEYLDKYLDKDRKEWFLIDTSILSKGENCLTISRRYSVSKITFLVWDVIFLCSILCWVNESVTIFSLNPNWKLTLMLGIFYTLIIGYILIFWVNGKVYEDYPHELNMIRKKFKKDKRKERKEWSKSEEAKKGGVFKTNVENELEKLSEKYTSNDFSEK